MRLTDLSFFLAEYCNRASKSQHDVWPSACHGRHYLTCMAASYPCPRIQLDDICLFHGLDLLKINISSSSSSSSTFDQQPACNFLYTEEVWNAWSTLHRAQEEEADTQASQGAATCSHRCRSLCPLHTRAAKEKRKAKFRLLLAEISAPTLLSLRGFTFEVEACASGKRCRALGQAWMSSASDWSELKFGGRM